MPLKLSFSAAVDGKYFCTYLRIAPSGSGVKVSNIKVHTHHTFAIDILVMFMYLECLGRVPNVSLHVS